MTHLEMKSVKGKDSLYTLTAELEIDKLTFDESITLQKTLKRIESERLVDVKLKYPSKMKHTQTTQHLRVSDEEKAVIRKAKTLEEAVVNYRSKFPNSQRSYLAIARQYDVLRIAQDGAKPGGKKLAPVPVRKTEPEIEKKPISVRLTSRLVSHYPSSGPSAGIPADPKPPQEEKMTSGEKEVPATITSQQSVKSPEKLTKAQIKEQGKPRVGQRVEHIGSVNSEYYGKKGEIIGITDGKIIEVKFDEGKTAKIHALSLKPI